MAFEITILSDVKDLERELGSLRKKVVPRATVRVVNRVTSTTRTATTRLLAKKIRAKVSEVKKRLYLRKASIKYKQGSIVALKGHTKLIDFVVGSKKPTQQPKRKRGKVRINVFGQVTTLNNSFIAPKNSGGKQTTVYKRVGAKRYPIRELYGPSIQKEFIKPEVEEAMRRKVIERLPVEMKSSIEFYKKKYSSL